MFLIRICVVLSPLILKGETGPCCGGKGDGFGFEQDAEPLKHQEGPRNLEDEDQVMKLEQRVPDEGVFGDADEVKSVSVLVMEGENITLHSNVTESVHMILWRFGPQETLIARIHRKASEISVYDDVLDGRFIGRLQVDNQTGSLTITNITTQHSGLYQMTIYSIKETKHKFCLNAHARLPVPVISRNSSQCSSSSKRSSVSNCSVLCSVMNVTRVSLSWYKGKSLLSSISVSDLNIRLSLPLEVEYQDTNTYRCVINNTITNHTQHLNINDVCQLCSGFKDHSNLWIVAVIVVLILIAAAAVVKYCKKKTTTIQGAQQAEMMPMNNNNNMAPNTDEVSGPLVASNGVKHYSNSPNSCMV